MSRPPSVPVLIHEDDLVHLGWIYGAEILTDCDRLSSAIGGGAGWADHLDVEANCPECLRAQKPP